ncbi:MAG: hypothetical protein AAF919_19280 [Pseudomonadota bacterium]
MTPDLFHRLVDHAARAPSVHNVQPARWRQDGDGILLLEDRTRRLAVGDPSGHDAALSLGAAAEGLVIAASAEGLRAHVTQLDPAETGEHQACARITFTPGAAPDPLLAAVAARRSWRGAFRPPGEADRRAAADLASDDCHPVTAASDIAAIATLYDQASLGFMRDPAFRAELLGWMRLSPRNPRWPLDGLNAAAMHLGRLERWGAGLLMGRAFGVIARLGLAPPLLSEKAKTATSSAIVVFHRPISETAFDHGRAFYRAWLRMEAADFGAAVLAALADDPSAAPAVTDRVPLPPGHRLVSAFRIGRRPDHVPVPRARRPQRERLG